MNTTHLSGGEIQIFQSKDGKASLEVKLNEETVWLTQDQMAALFDKGRSTVAEHIQNVFKEGELDEISVCRDFRRTGTDGKEYTVKSYNLDVIISVGYRVKSVRGTQFRIWATSVLKDHILKGYTLNQKRLQEKGLTEFEEAVGLIKRTMETKALTDSESKGLLDVITSYASTWVLLQKYDQDTLVLPKTRKPKIKFDYGFCKDAIGQLKDELLKKKEATDLFGNERDHGLEGVIGNIQQTFSQEELYPSLEEKAAHLLYFIIKDHPFTDGNKRIGSFLFIVYLAKNNHLYRKNGEKKINDNTLTALALLIAESAPKQKAVLILVVMHFLSEK